MNASDAALAAAVRVSVRLAAAGVCPAAPPGVTKYTNEVLAWVKWTVLAMTGILTVASVGMLIWGRVTHHPKGARLGFDGIMIIGVGSILFVVLPPMFASIIGKGC